VVWVVAPLLLVTAVLVDLLVRRGSWILRVLAEASDA
jgi:hypothetical protein